MKLCRGCRLSRFRQVRTRRAVEFLQGLPHVPKQGGGRP